MSDDSSIIASSLPATQPLVVNEITTLSRLDLFINDSLRHNHGCLALCVMEFVWFSEVTNIQVTKFYKHSIHNKLVPDIFAF